MKKRDLIHQILSQCQSMQQELQKIKESISLEKSVMNVNDLCYYSGMSKATIYRITSQGLIRHSKPTGSLLFFKKVDVDNFLLQNPVTPAEKISDVATDHIIRNRSKKLNNRKN